MAKVRYLDFEFSAESRINVRDTRFRDSTNVAVFYYNFSEMYLPRTKLYLNGYYNSSTMFYLSIFFLVQLDSLSSTYRVIHER